MDASYIISSGELIGVLKTILVFLESLDFENACEVLRKECIAKGLPEVLAALDKQSKEARTDCHVYYSNYPAQPHGCACKNEVLEDVCTCSRDWKMSDKLPNTTQTQKKTSKDSINQTEKLLRKTRSNLALEHDTNKTAECSGGEETSCGDLKRKFRQLQMDHAKLMSVAAELTMALQTQILGQSENLNIMLNNCKCIYPDLFSSGKSVSPGPSNTVSSEAISVSVIQDQDGAANPEEEEERSCVDVTQEKDIAGEPSRQEENAPVIFVTSSTRLEKSYSKCQEEGPLSVFELDFRAIRKDLQAISSDDLVKLGLIQALRWRITRSTRETRDSVVNSYIRYDLLGLHSSPSNSGQSCLERFLCPNNKTAPHQLQEGMARFLNSLASLTLGRDYLCQDDDLLVALLVPLVLGTHYSKANLDDITRDMLLATLQKLSLRHRQRLLMISAGLLEHLLGFLSTRHGELTQYSLEYSTALFMNLCLHQEARQRLHAHIENVVTLVTALLDSPYESCLPYVNGTIYSLLRDGYINNKVRRMEFASVLQAHIEKTEGDTRRQLEFLLKLHLEGSEDDNFCGCDPGNQPENEVDLLEPELDENDSFHRGPAGEDLLMNYKLLFPIFGSQVYAGAQSKCIRHPSTFGLQTSKSNEEKIAMSDERSAPTPSVSSSKFDERPPSLHHGDVIHSNATSPRESFSEDTKQFYHTPSLKSGIFESEKKKKLYRMPPSFTRTIAMSPTSLSKSAPGTPKNEGSFAYIQHPHRVASCYRETAAALCKCSQCCKRNRYACNCYNAIKGCLMMANETKMDEKSGENSASGRNTRSNKQNVSVGNFSSLQEDDDDDHDAESTNFSYRVLASHLNGDIENHNCPSTGHQCRCYDTAFQSRPKILRTPP